VIKLKRRIRLFAFIPLFGQSGDVINEGQLVNAISNYVESIYCFTFVSFHHIFFKKTLKPAVPLNKNVKIITLPGLPLPYIFMLVNILYNMLIGIVCVIIERAIKPDIIYIRNKLVAFSLLTLKPFVKKPITFKFDNFAADEVLPTIKQKKLRNVTGKILWTIDYYTLRNADLLLVHSDIMKNSIVEKSLIEYHKILICPPGIDLEKIKRIKEGKAPSLKNGIRIGFLGSLTWWQGIDILAEAITMIKERLPHAELFIVGDGPMREKVAKICEKHKIKCIITGFVPHEEALRYLKSFDVLALPRRKTPATEANIPIKVMEAWALGVPVIVTSHKVFKSICKDNEYAIFVDPSPKDVAEKILLLALNSELRERLARNGQTLVQSFDYKTIAERLLASILQSI
jgi:glycosyltransferase involved in cell wall biosynthesis